jgi:hypothetical protein
MPMTAVMHRVPFRSVARGLRHSDVAEMLQKQMELARSDPAAALELLANATMADSSPGVDRDEVHTWMDDQRAWLRGRIQGSNGIDLASSSLSAALDDLKLAVEMSARRAEKHAEIAGAEAERRCAALIAAAERRLAEELSRSRRKMRNDAIRIRKEAQAEAEQLLERARSHVGRMLLDAEQRERETTAAQERTRELQADLLNSIDAAQATVRTSRAA